MPDDDERSSLPAVPGRRTLDRAALERVLARAAELQVGAESDEPRDDLTEEQLLELGREVGLSADALRRALAEERTRVALAPESGVAARLAGPGHVAAARIVRGTPADLLALLDTWMRKEECLQSVRRQADRMTWEPRRDMMGRMRVGLNMGGRGYHLSRAAEVAATVAAVDGERTHVQLVADVTRSRRGRLAGGTALASAGLMGGSALMTIPLVAPHALVLPIAAGAAAMTAAGALGGLAVARTHRAAALRVQIALEQLLDRLERGELRPLPPGGQLLETLQAALRRPPR